MFFRLIPLVSGLFFISACSQTDPEPKNDNTQKPTEAETKELKYQKKRSGFDAANYTFPKSSLNTLKKNAACSNGIGGEMAAFTPGVFSKALFAVDADILPTDMAGENAYAPYSKVFSVEGDILWQKDVDTFDRALLTQRQISRGRANRYLVQGGTAYRSTFDEMETNNGFPVGYLMAHAGLYSSLSSYNDDCVKGIDTKNIKWAKVDLSGQPISSILAQENTERMYYGLNGLYTHSQTSYRFINSNFGRWLQANPTLYKRMSNIGKFPDGSYVYVPETAEALESINYIDMSNINELKMTLDEIKEHMISNTIYKSNFVVLNERKFNDGLAVYYPYSVDSGKPITDLPIVAKKDNKFFFGISTEKANITYSTYSTGSQAMMNDVAHAALLAKVKGIYQGQSAAKLTDYQQQIEKSTLTGR